MRTGPTDILDTASALSTCGGTSDISQPPAMLAIARDAPSTSDALFVPLIGVSMPATSAPSEEPSPPPTRTFSA